MKTKYISVLLGLLLSTVFLQAQSLRGIVYENVNNDTIPLPGVNIYWEGTQKEPLPMRKAASPSKKPKVRIISFLAS